MKNSTTVIFLFILPFITFGQTDPAILWQNTIGGSFNETLGSVIATNDGGCVIAGYSNSNISGDKTEDSNGAQDYWVLKLSDIGEIEWQKTIGGNLGDYLNSIIPTQDGGYVMSGYSDSGISGDKTEPSNGNRDFWIVKIDSVGLIEWQNTIGGNDLEENAYIIQTPDLGYFVGGTSASNISGDKTEDSNGLTDFWLLKLNPSGVIEWQNTIGGEGGEILLSIDKANAGGYLIAGSSASNISGDKTENNIGQTDYWVLKLDNSGNIEWQNTIGGTGNDLLSYASSTTDGGYIIGGESESNISGDKTENAVGDYDFWVLKLNAVGEIEWQNTIGGNSVEAKLVIFETTDGGYILGGDSTSDISGDKTEDSIGANDYWVLKLTSLGEIVWQNTIGGDKHDYLNSMAINSEDEIFLAGSSYSNISGDKTENTIGGKDFWIIKHSPEIPLGIHGYETYQINCFPNPAETTINLKSQVTYFNSVKIYSNKGDLIMRSSFPNMIRDAQIDVSKFSTGVYTVVLSDNYKTYTTRFIKK